MLKRDDIIAEYLRFFRKLDSKLESLFFFAPLNHVHFTCFTILMVSNSTFVLDFSRIFSITEI